MISEDSLPTKSRSLRAKSIAKRLATEKNQSDGKQTGRKTSTNFKASAKRSSSSSSKHHTMSKYRRKVANAKERERMKLVSEAFDKLSSVVPVYKMMTSESSVSNRSINEPLTLQQNSPQSPPPDLENKNPVTKVSTLRCAISYINSLQRLIEDANRGTLDPSLYTLTDEDDDLDEILPTEPKVKKPAKTQKSANKNRKRNENKKGNNGSKNKSGENALKKVRKPKNKANLGVGGFKVRQYHASDFSARHNHRGKLITNFSNSNSGAKSKASHHATSLQIGGNFKPMSKAQLNLAIAKGLQNCKPIYTPPPPVAKKAPILQVQPPLTQTGFNNPTPLQLIQLRPMNLNSESTLIENDPEPIDFKFSGTHQNSSMVPNLEVFLQQASSPGNSGFPPAQSPTGSTISGASSNSCPNSLGSSPGGGSESPCFNTILEETHILDDIQAVLLDSDNFDILV